MKKIILLAGLFFILLLLNSCLTTLHPIFTEKDLVADTRLIGKWEKTKDGSMAIYRQAGANDLKGLSTELQRNANKIYILEENDPQGNLKSIYYAFLVKLGKYYYMDYYPTSTNEKKSADDFFAAHYIPMHNIYRIKFSSNRSFEIQRFDAGYMEKLIRNRQVRIKHEVMEDGDFVITASTEELQQYLIKYSDTPEAYNEDNSFTYTKTN
jgi:hypothetical protein